MMLLTSFEFTHSITLFLVLTSFFVTLLIYLIIILNDKTADPFKTLAMGLSGVTVMKEFTLFFLMFEVSSLLFLSAMISKYVFEVHILYEIIEIPAVLIFTLAMLRLLLLYIQNRRTIIDGKKLSND